MSPKTKPLDPYLLTFLQDHPLARSVVYGMMKNAATMKDDPKMVVWYAPVAMLPLDQQHEAFLQLCDD